MNFFDFTVARLCKEETFVNNDKNIKIYDGNEKVNYDK